MFYIMLQRRDDWGNMCFYRFGKAIKTKTKAISIAKKLVDAYVVDNKNVCIYINN